ncbi:hypothetical protein PUN28_002036 [Cardiocondyla obscurior]|uniref:Uncharacterized protein n=1 Tax=Cardiocondyla obscurior TaxID=286306 RepID=A0AAW2GS84_9HYME
MKYKLGGISVLRDLQCLKIENPEKSQSSSVTCGRRRGLLLTPWTSRYEKEEEEEEEEEEKEVLQVVASAEQPHGKDIVKCWTCRVINSQHPERRRRPRMGILLRLSNVSNVSTIIILFLCYSVIKTALLNSAAAHRTGESTILFCMGYGF